MINKVFRRKASRVCVSFSGYGMVPIASEHDDQPVFYTAPPRRIGDDAIVVVEGKRRMVRLLKSQFPSKVRTYLVDIGPAR